VAAIHWHVSRDESGSAHCLHQAAPSPSALTAQRLLYSGPWLPRAAYGFILPLQIVPVTRPSPSCQVHLLIPSLYTLPQPALACAGHWALGLVLCLLASHCIAQCACPLVQEDSAVIS
jgi:hypothetical protein